MSLISKDSVILKQGRRLKSFGFSQSITMLGDAVIEEKKAVLDAQRTQLLTGVGNDGKKIKPKYRNKKYAQKKSSLNPLAGTGTPDLKLSGDLHDDLDLTVGVPNDKSYTVFSGVEYFSQLAEKYNTAFDLSKNNASKVIEVTNNYFKKVHKFINK